LLGLPRYPIRTQLIPARLRARRSRKGGGSIACWEEGAGKRTDVARPRQRKTCMVKARLPEPQSSWPYSRRRRSIGETPHQEIRTDALLLPVHMRALSNSVHVLGFSGMPSVGGIKGTNEAPNRVASLLPCKGGIAYAGAVSRHTPVWRRSLHSTQGWPVMGSADDAIPSYGHGYKSCGNTDESPRGRGKGDSFHRLYIRTQGCADATRNS
jgi:hypothetical protein